MTAGPGQGGLSDTFGSKRDSRQEEWTWWLCLRDSSSSQKVSLMLQDFCALKLSWGSDLLRQCLWRCWKGLSEVARSIREGHW